MLVVIAGPSAAFTHRPENQVPQGSRNLQVILNFRKKLFTQKQKLYITMYITIYHARKMKKLMFFAIIKFVLLQAV